MSDTTSVVMLGATGAVGGEVLQTLLHMDTVQRITLLGRRDVAWASNHKLVQHVVDVHDPASYAEFLPGHTTSICTFGVGEPSKAERAEFTRVDHDAPLAFATACKAAGVKHFRLLSAVGASSKSRSFYLRTKGELEQSLIALGFDRLSLFHPSMILTPTNRYGLSQAVVLGVWPKLSPLLVGPMRKLRGIKVEDLGRAMACNTTGNGQPRVEILEWDQFMTLSAAASRA
jgi:uncharacterized protein YbjT (DUF2867 family)